MIENNILDLSKLPGDARRELVDFYEFLRSKYSENQENKLRDISCIIPRKVSAFISLTREEAHER